MEESHKKASALLAEVIANHFPEASIEGFTVDLGFAGLRIHCAVYSIEAWGKLYCASLFFDISGGALGASPIFASISGYADTPQAALVTGACNWACSFGPVLRVGLNGERQRGGR